MLFYDQSLHVLAVSAWASSGSSGFLLQSEYLQVTVGGLEMQNLPTGVNLLSDCVFAMQWVRNLSKLYQPLVKSGWYW